jgi:FKBP-type peptidyl-prolyl cis-trans isomerase (trigger factor)
MAKTIPSKDTTKKTTPKNDAHAHDHNHDHDHQHSTGPKLPIAPNSELKIKLQWATVEPAYQKALRRYAREMKTDGFRKGKVPLSVVEGMVKPEALVEYVLQQILPDAYADAIKAANKRPISQPEIDPIKVDKGSDWELVVYFAETPDIKLGKYQDSVKKAGKDAAKDITDQEAELKKKATEAKKDDKVEAKTDEQPETLTDAQKDELKTRQIFRHLVKELNPQIPELLVRREADRELRRVLEQLDQVKISLENYLKSRQMTVEQLRLEYISSAATSLQLEFILAEIGKTEKITVEDKEIDETLVRVFGENVSAAQRNNSEYRSYLFSSLVKQKIAKHLLSLL